MGKRGMPTVPALREITGTTRKARHSPEALADQVNMVNIEKLPDPPDTLDERACAEWYRVGTALHAAGVLHNIDSFFLEQYCFYWSLHYDLKISFNQMKGMDEQTHGVLVRGMHGPTRNPIYREMMSAGREAEFYGAKIGIGPSARSRLALARQEEETTSVGAKFFA